MYGSSFVRNLDAWDGYPADKDRVMEILEGKENILVLSGDTHTSWAFEVPVDIESYRADSTDLRAVEIGTPSITSANHDESSRADRDPRLLEKAMLDKQYNPHMKYRNITEHGFVLLHITKEIVTADWYFVPTIKEKVDGIEKVHTVTIQSGSYELD
ncbi:MAG: alkaline phosphatase D family protein, partial [Saprospiraceae bacterium]|nr:alkaline phosphatase D family protein [Saprospiraceae bacterium]